MPVASSETMQASNKNGIHTGFELSCSHREEWYQKKKKNPQISTATLQNNLSGLINGVPTRKRLSALMLCAFASINI